MTERAEVAALGAIVAGLAIVALAQLGLPAAGPAAEGTTAIQPRGTGAARARPPASALVALRDGQTIDLNCADVATLELLPGVGPTLARRIVERRATAGPFESVDALDAVYGVGAKTLGRVRPLLSVGVSCPASTKPTR